jgi:hypothetical protein
VKNTVKRAEKFQAERLYEEVLAALSPFHAQPLNPNPSPDDPDYLKLRLIAYAARSQQLESILKRLGAREYCASECAKGPDGCCSDHGYDVENDDFFEFLALQEVEARRHGWLGPDKRCRYHSHDGCMLSLFKAPACLKLLCRTLVKDLDRRFGPTAYDFADAVEHITLDIQRSPLLLGELDEAIGIGNRLLAGKS